MTERAERLREAISDAVKVSAAPSEEIGGHVDIYTLVDTTGVARAICEELGVTEEMVKWLREVAFGVQASQLQIGGWLSTDAEENMEWDRRHGVPQMKQAADALATLLEASRAVDTGR